MKSIFIILIIFIFIISFGFRKETIMNKQKDTKSEIIWKPNVRLTWGSFQGKPDTLSEFAASTKAGMYFRYSTQGFNLNLEFPAYFNKLESWTKNRVSNAVLRHEQIHFDIIELGARQLRKECLELETKDMLLSKAKEEITQLYYKYDKVNRELNAQFDKETDHGGIYSKEAEWEEKIPLELKTLNKYTSYKVVKRFKKTW